MSENDNNDLLENLYIMHRDLDHKINALYDKEVIDTVELMRLKKEKLYVKDKIILLESKNHPDIIA